MNNESNAKNLKTVQKITDMISKIENEQLLNRIYRFVKFLYIHKM